MTWPEFWSTILPPIAAALAAIISAAAWTAVAYLKSMRDKFEEAKDREALHSAISTGVRAELELDPHASDKQIASGAAKYVMSSGAPDAAKAFGLTGPELSTLIASKVGGERAKRQDDKPC